MALRHAQAAGRVANVVGRALTEAASNPQHRLQIYLSRDQDPHVNLAVEQHLLEASHRDSRILFLYTNRPSVIVGRSQNPWLETDLARIRSGLPALGSSFPGSAGAGSSSSSSPDDGGGRPVVPVDLVRRRSGGGTVFHDWGNMNYSVIAPRAGFDPDRHALMVAAALRESLAVPGVRVTERHDIVMDVPVPEDPPPPPPAVSTFKISGSAYRLNGMRSLHHGTCLLRSPYLAQIGPLLRSPAAPFLRSTGIASVRSPVRNVGVDPAAFQAAVRERFTSKYEHLLGGDGSLFVGSVGSDALAIPEVAKVVAELRSPEWKFGQTTQFTFSTHPTEEDPRERPPLPSDVPANFRAGMTIRYGKIKNCDIAGIDSASSLSHDTSSGTEAMASLNNALVGLNLHEITDWRNTLARLSPASPAISSVGSWLNTIFGNSCS
ncbi:hypothetical protein GGTG_06432 [Gaeumannomyces tritici R3-111a-1]|uniref:Putative lipoate-protein ligase A n=1 Tax=Gaeumannomyces tritici (strain R3-111a-1) TaxID=644352 RepID=J3NYT0_GAET3|nr:hypothetical protein GGTG_06432 [Gaeumannomyces tritici R3-111a-1]EJT76513.1 hypothetical protein GGTG_06432 [Gaeumannomyces tritici R3-111a-1]